MTIEIIKKGISPYEKEYTSYHTACSSTLKFKLEDVTVDSENQDGLWVSFKCPVCNIYNRHWIFYHAA